MPQMILGIHVGPNAISWTLLNSNFKILNWDCLVWRNKTSKITTYDIISSVNILNLIFQVQDKYFI